MSQEGVIVWSPDTLLEWNGFEADPHPGMYQDALARIRYGCTWSVESHREGDDILFSIEKIRLTTQFVKNLSWVRKESAAERLRVHVQGCFDLAEELRPRMESLLAERFAGRMYPVRGSNPDEQKQNSMQDSRLALGRLEEIHGMLDAEIEEYQTRTRYGEDRPAQESYNARFSRMRSIRSA